MNSGASGAPRIAETGNRVRRHPVGRWMIQLPLTPPDEFEAPGSDDEGFYAEVVRLMAESGIPFLLSGTYALSCYTGIIRPTKDVDVFAKAGDALRMLSFFKERGFDVEIVDDRWLARVTRGELFVDIITNMPTSATHVTDEWFQDAPEALLFDTKVHLVPPTQFVWSKIYVQDRYRYDGADVTHMILKRSQDIDWKQLISSMELHWEVLLVALLNFRFIYPSERHLIPRWVMDELLERLNAQLKCRPRARGSAAAASSAPATIRSTSANGASPKPSEISKRIMQQHTDDDHGRRDRRPSRHREQQRTLSRDVRRSFARRRRAGAVRRPHQLRQDDARPKSSPRISGPARSRSSACSATTIMNADSRRWSPASCTTPE